jgi:LemA protein
MAAWIFLGIVVLAVMFFVGAYNSLVQLRNRVKNAWSQIDVQLKRRHDLIPNLVETAKGYMAHERETLTAITEARSRAMGAGTVAEKGVAETQLTQALSRFLVSVENYPT